MKIKTYVINLKESVVRRNALLSEVAKYPCMDVEIVEAVNGRKMSSEDIKKNFDVLKFGEPPSVVRSVVCTAIGNVTKDYWRRVKSSLWYWKMM